MLTANPLMVPYTLDRPRPAVSLDRSGAVPDLRRSSLRTCAAWMQFSLVQAEGLAHSSIYQDDSGPAGQRSETAPCAHLSGGLVIGQGQDRIYNRDFSRPAQSKPRLPAHGKQVVSCL